MATTTFGVATGMVSGDDRQVYKNSVSGEYPPTGTTQLASTATIHFGPARIWETGTPVFYQVLNILLRWDTSSIPDDATITAANLSIEMAGPVRDANNLNLTAEYFAWNGTASDYSVGPGNGDAISAYDITSIGSSGIRTIPLDGLSGISKTGYTSLRLHMTSATPTGENYPVFAAVDHASMQEPRLVVDYDETPTPQQLVVGMARW